MSVALVFRATDAAANAVNSNSMNWAITVAGDPFYSLVALLLHADAYPLVDNGPAARTPGTATGAPALDTTNKVFGAGSVSFTASNNSGVPWASIPTIAANQAYALEFRIRFTSVAAGIYFMAIDGATADLYVYTNAAGKLAVNMIGSAHENLADVVINTWYAIKICESGTQQRIMLDGAVIFSAAASHGATGVSTFNLGFWSGAGGSSGGRCQIDELRLTIGNDRGLVAYTPDAAPFPDS